MTSLFDIAINRLYSGEKLPKGDHRWGRFTGSFVKMTLTVDEFIDEVVRGHSFSPVMKGGYRKQENFISAQHIGLDDDRGISESSIDALSNDPFVANHASFLYETISSTLAHPKSRIVFILDSPITDREQYRLAQEALWWKYSASDPHVKEESRFFYGSPGARVIKLGNILYGDVLQEQVIEPFLLAHQTRTNGHKLIQPVGAIITEGRRNNTLASFAGTMRRRDMSEEAITAALLVENEKKCDPVLPESEVRRIAKSVSRYPPSDEHHTNGHRPSGTEPGNLTSDPEILSSEVRLRRVSAADLQRRALEGLIPHLERLPFLGQSECSPFIRGWSHMLSGYPKTGKTELLVRIASEMSRAGLLLLFLTEEPESVWTARLAGLPLELKNVDLLFAIGQKAEDLFLAIAGGQDDVVILDTIRLLGITDENDNSKVNLALTPFIAQCRAGNKTLILAHHNRKGGGEYGEAAAGGHAFVGIVDVALELQRDRQASRRRQLRGWGRVVDVPELVYELRDDGNMALLGDPRLLELQEVKDRALDCLTEEWQTTKAIREALDDPKPSQDQMSLALAALSKDGIAERDPPLEEGSKRGKTYRWRSKT